MSAYFLPCSSQVWQKLQKFQQYLKSENYCQSKNVKWVLVLVIMKQIVRNLAARTMHRHLMLTKLYHSMNDIMPHRQEAAAYKS